MWFVTLCSCATPLEDAAGDDAESPAGRPAIASAVYQAASGDSAPQTGAVTMRIVNATGPGCPDQPSWDQEEVPEQRAFTLTLHKMELDVPPVRTPVTLETYCDVTVAIASALPVSWSVTGLNYNGYASLKSGMTGTLGVRYDFTANRSIAQMPELLRELEVPMADNFFHDADPLRVVWSPCTTSSLLGMRLRIRLHSENRQEAGKIALSYVDGRLAEVRVDLASRSCATRNEVATR